MSLAALAVAVAWRSSVPADVAAVRPTESPVRRIPVVGTEVGHDNGPGVQSRSRSQDAYTGMLDVMSELATTARPAGIVVKMARRLAVALTIAVTVWLLLLTH